MLTLDKRKGRKYPNSFIVLIFATFIDRLGGFLLFPFFAVYLIDHFNVTIIEVGFMFSIFAFGSIIGSTIGGALTDKYGRRSMLVFGLISSGIGSILMGIVDELYLFFLIALVLGILGDLGGPARQERRASLGAQNALAVRQSLSFPSHRSGLGPCHHQDEWPPSLRDPGYAQRSRMGRAPSPQADYLRKQGG